MTPEDPNPVPDLPKDTAGHDDWSGIRCGDFRI
jgi:hypothetical protein